MRVYIAGPYSGGDTGVNVRAAVAAGESVRAAGHLPFVPHLFHLWHLTSPHPEDYWLSMDHEWLATCGALIRLPGLSPGSDGEVALAESMDIPVYMGVNAFLPNGRCTACGGDGEVLTWQEPHTKLRWEQEQRMVPCARCSSSGMAP